MISVVLADDQAMLRMGFRMILEATDDLRVVAEAGDGDEAVRQTELTRPDVVLMDVRMPRTDGIAATARIAAGDTGARVIILTTYDLDEYVYAGLRAGASGFLVKDAPPDQLLTAIRTVAAGDAVLAPAATRRLLDRFTPLLPAGDAARPPGLPGELTDREGEVFRLVAEGLTNREIAGRLHVAEGTVKVHVGRLLAKLGARDRVQLVVLGYELGVVRPSGELPKN